MDWIRFVPVGGVCRTLADFLFPPLCYACGALLPPGCRIACPECRNEMRVVCRDDLLFAVARDRLCGDGAVDELFSLFTFEKGKGVQSLLHELKYAGAVGVGRWLGSQLGLAIQAQGWAAEIDAIIPVPLHLVKRRERGYNQSEMIARGIRSILNTPVDPGAVRRCRHTPTQTALGIDDRRRNMEGAFVVPRKRQGTIGGKRFLLVDDVITTGATIRSCAGALKAAGARSIVACSVGLADRTNQ